MDVDVPVGEVALAGLLTLPPGAQGVVVFAHGSGSGRFSPRNQAVADELGRAGFGTLLLDLLTSDEEAEDRRSARLRFDIGLLAKRVVGAIDWLAAKRWSETCRPASAIFRWAVSEPAPARRRR